MNRKAFSLIELSIAIAIMGLIIISVTGGQVLIEKSKIIKAKNLTKNSPVSSTDGLVLWLEPVMEGAFKDDNGEDVAYGSPIDEWRNSTGLEEFLPSFTQNVNDTFRPTLIEKGPNSLPTVRFDGTNDYLRYDKLVVGAYSDLTLFVVFSHNSVSSVIFGQFPANYTNTNHYLTFYSTDNKVYFDQYRPSGGSIPSGTTVAPNTTILVTITYDRNGNTVSRINGSNQSTGISETYDYTVSGGVSAVSTLGARLYNGSQTSHSSCYPMNGDISEIAIFKRILSNNEIELIETYLKDKYKID